MLVDFYLLGAAPLERVLPRICERLLADGQRLLIVGERELLGRTDQQLWSYARDAFLPHAIAGGENDAAQPILLSETPEPANGAVNIALIDGVWRDEALSFQRCFYLFDATTLDGARTAWRSLSKGGAAECRYWKQDEQGKWVQGP